jgi:hypothetical protein
MAQATRAATARPGKPTATAPRAHVTPTTARPTVHLIAWGRAQAIGTPARQLDAEAPRLALPCLGESTRLGAAPDHNTRRGKRLTRRRRFAIAGLRSTRRDHRPRSRCDNDCVDSRNAALEGKAELSLRNTGVPLQTAAGHPKSANLQKAPRDAGCARHPGGAYLQHAVVQVHG